MTEDKIKFLFNSSCPVRDTHRDERRRMGNVRGLEEVADVAYYH